MVIANAEETVSQSGWGGERFNPSEVGSESENLFEELR
jgi:hypothetical protein